MKNEENERILIEEFVPVTVKENTVNTSSVELIDRGTMKASWYGPKFHGKLTANGEVYDQMALTAAHKNLSFGTLLKITNPKNGRSVIVRINDEVLTLKVENLIYQRVPQLNLEYSEKGLPRLKIQEVALGESK